MQDTVPREEKRVEQKAAVPGLLRLYAKLPPERVGVLIGEGGKVKTEIMKRTRTKITVDSTTGMVIIEPESPDVPPFMVMKAQEIVKAIAYGFSPERAMRLLDDDQILVVVDLKQYVGDAPNHLQRVKGRIIGEKGKARKTIEEMTGTYISIYDNYVAIIGDFETANIAKQAIEMLIQGRQHSTVYRFLERTMFKVRRSRMTQLWEQPF
ncbi:putative RNA-processing protein [Pyrodictium delaneyi]|uniref:Putative RNA-processing protein n=1 Tax=Pyrodictium delaneyi TaxID=1273541 RepID=A0A0P0N3R0_9CREN|nr:KH domain-containing protein [Pyrodictium delaneyi]ALL01310.1 putative RNA-processing protein [Pyrodictium delaneyi]